MSPKFRLDAVEQPPTDSVQRSTYVRLEPLLPFGDLTDTEGLDIAKLQQFRIGGVEFLAALLHGRKVKFRIVARAVDGNLCKCVDQFFANVGRRLLAVSRSCGLRSWPSAAPTRKSCCRARTSRTYAKEPGRSPGTGHLHRPSFARWQRCRRRARSGGERPVRKTDCGGPVRSFDNTNADRCRHRRHPCSRMPSAKPYTNGDLGQELIIEDLKIFQNGSASSRNMIPG